MDARNEFFGLERFTDVIVRAESKAADFHLRLIARREKDDGDVARARILFNQTAGVQSIHLRHHHVQDHQVGQGFFSLLDSLASVLRRQHTIPLALQATLNQRTIDRLVVRHENRLHSFFDCIYHT